jgi:YD repeat-containing protein
LLEGRDLIVRELLRTVNYHPVHDPILNVHYIMKEDEKKDFALKVQHSGKEFIILFIVHNGRLVLLINYMSIPEEIFLLSVYKLARKFMWAKSIETQRNYNNYNIPFIKKEELDSYVIALSQGYDSYFNSLGSNTRFNIRYYYKKMKKDFYNVEVEIYQRCFLSPDLFNQFIKLATIDQLGRVWRYSYDEYGHLKEEIDPQLHLRTKA